MNIGFIGLGKLGFPVALAIESKGHDVIGYDQDPRIVGYLANKSYPHQEKGLQPLLDKTRLKLATIKQVVEHSEIIFVAVQTPHAKEYEGITPIPETRRDFDYSYLVKAVRDLSEEISAHGRPKTVVIISTVLPGTIRRCVLPEIKDRSLFHLVYEPLFIAMGQVVDDYLNPEFVLAGSEHQHAIDDLVRFYETIHDRPVFETTIETAELIKVAYNTFIGMKIAFANTMMEICHKTPNARCDDVSLAMSMATDRLMSRKYLNGGMGDGGGCHPRDNIAMSWLARELDLSHNFFDDIMRAREDQTKWLADVIIQRHRDSGLPIVLLGAEFKPNTNITTGSPALLLAHYLRERGYNFFIHDRSATVQWEGPQLFFVSCQHQDWLQLDIPSDSEVIDPWRWVEMSNHVLDCGAIYYPIGGMA